jgi:hypothetical protein
MDTIKFRDPNRITHEEELSIQIDLILDLIDRPYPKETNDILWEIYGELIKEMNRITGESG